MAQTSMKIDSERHHFTMYWNVEQYDDGTKYVFCDELDEYTFHPYSGALKEVPGYAEDKAAFEDVRIFLTINTTGKLVKVPCNIVENSKRIYIEDRNFSKYWKLISENICRGIRRKLNSNEITHASMNDKVDLSLLESPTRMAEVTNAFTLEYKGKEIDIETQRLISKRASALEDHRLGFVYAKSDRFVHDKTCQQVNKIKYWDFGAAEEIPAERELCPQCKKKMIIRSAIKTDKKRFAWYLRFFEKGRVSGQTIEKFLYRKDVELHMETMDELIVKCKEDTWRIKMTSQGTYKLYHNNYVMVSDDERYITSGFHDQKHYPERLSGILHYIEKYDWQVHLESKEPEVVEVINEEVNVADTRESFMNKFKKVLKKLFGNKKNVVETIRPDEYNRTSG